MTPTKLGTQSRDYRVRISVTFCVDVAATEPAHAESIAEAITMFVFHEHYSRADRLVIETLNSWRLATYDRP